MSLFRLAAAILSFLSVSAFAQTANVSAPPITDADVKLLREDIQAEKNQIIDHTMVFTKAEAEAFGPVYQEYAGEQQAIGKKRGQLMTDYAQSLDSMTDVKAKAMTERLFAIESETVALKRKYLPRFEKALGAKRAARFYQVDNRLSLLVNLQLATMVPLVP